MCHPFSTSCDYVVAGQRFRLEGPHADFGPRSGFSVFKRAAENVSENLSAAAPIFCLATGVDVVKSMDQSQLKELYVFDYFGAKSRFCTYQDGYCFWIQEPQHTPLVMVVPADKNKCTTNCGLVEPFDLPRFVYLLWLLYGIAALPHKTLAFHASVAVHSGKAVLFIAESGTGKSTQTRLWREHIPGTGFLNDDSPMVHLTPEGPWAYGSPWSGKLPVYLDTQYPLAALIRLSQAPYNALSPRLGKLEALAATLPACAPELLYSESLTDGMCAVLTQVVDTVPVYKLACLPNAEAALLVFNRLKDEGVL